MPLPAPRRQGPRKRRCSMQNRGIDEIMSQLRAAEALAAGRPANTGPAKTEGDAAVDFAGALSAAVNRVNAAQSSALAAARNFETGDKEVGLHEVMLAMQKANI